MPELRCFRLHEQINGQAPQSFDDYVDFDGLVTSYDPVSLGNFTARLYVRSTQPHAPSWTEFLTPARAAVEASPRANADWPIVSSAGALLVVRVDEPALGHFAFSFGTGGRLILKQEAYQRAFGLRTALNLIYPSNDSSDDYSRLRSVDARKHGAETVRTRQQTARAATFETFGVDQSQSIVDAAVGRPANESTWGKRMSGTDSLGFSIEAEFKDLGNICGRVHQAAQRLDYRERFPWLDDIRPVTDPRITAKVTDDLIARLWKRDTGDLELAPPTIIDWGKSLLLQDSLRQERGLPS